MAKTPITKLDPATATVREVAVEYARRQGHENVNDYVNAAVRYLGKYADQPGSAVDMFMPDDDGETKLSRTFKLLDEGGEKVAKDSMQVLRYVGTTIAQDLPPNSNILAFLPDVGPDTPRNVKIFGRKEPPKAVSGITIKTDRETMASMFRQIMEIAKDPKQEAAAMATLFNLQNGLRPNAAGMLKLESYYPETRAIYISAETKGAKGRRVNVPLNDIADTILQNRLEDAKKRGDGYFFVKPNGKPVESGDITAILKQVKIPNLVFDPEGNDGRGRFYDSLAPEGDDVPGKRGSPLIRNIHTKIGQRNGISFERIAYLQGRSLKSAAEGSVGDIVTYASDYPGDLEPGGPDARNANIISTYFAEAAEGAGFNISSTIVPPEQRIGRTTPGYESYFEAPIKDVGVSPIVSGDAIDGVSPESRKQLEADGFDDFFDVKEPVPEPEPEPDPPKKKRRRSRKQVKKAAVAAGTAAATTAAKAAKAAGFIVPGPDPFELAAGVLDEQMSPEGQSAADIAVERGQKFVGDLLGVEAGKAEGLSDLFTKKVAAETIGGVGGILADYATLGTVSGTGPFAGERTGSISGRNLRAQQLRERQNAEDGFVKRPGLGIPKP